MANVHAQATKIITTEVLIVGGGASGITAGIQCARMGISCTIAEPTTWLGGMVTSAGVSAFDGNHNIPSGLWAEFREQLYKVYGGANKVATGWVSNTLFEPHVGDSIFKAMAAAEKKLTVLYNYKFTNTLTKGNQIIGAAFINDNGERRKIFAQQIIDATELGDVLASAKVPYSLGMEASSLTGEKVNVPASNGIIQDITYTAILKDYGNVDSTIVKPANYYPMEFDGCNNQYASTPQKITSNVDAKKMLDYGKLPHGKYMINWPGKGNDIYLNVIEMPQAKREEAYKLAKAKTLRFIYFLQTQFGFKNLGLATDEFPTADRLPLIPYHRESRRVQGIVRFTLPYIDKPFAQPHALYRTGIAVGDYPIDHHHRENDHAPQHLGFYPVPSYNLPLGALIPTQHNGLIIAEKSTSVSNVVNGTTRLQPIVMLTGQAAGCLAALSVLGKCAARKVNVRSVQQALLTSKAYIMPYYDVKPSHPQWQAIQRIGASGILKGVGQPYQWANRTWYYPDSTVTEKELTDGLLPFFKQVYNFAESNNIVTIIYLQSIIKEKLLVAPSTLTINQAYWTSLGLTNYNPKRAITRAEIAQLLDATIKPFTKKNITHFGKYNN